MYKFHFLSRVSKDPYETIDLTIYPSLTAQIYDIYDISVLFSYNQLKVMGYC